MLKSTSCTNGSKNRTTEPRARWFQDSDYFSKSALMVSVRQ
jgi:hypothetical protein